MYVQLSTGFSTITMPFANYVWMCGNPSFASIPRGYVIHHLDHNKLNDDITNLAIMFKHHHYAHHIKEKTIDTPVELETIGQEDILFDNPISQPRLAYMKDRGYYKLRYLINIDDTKKKRREFHKVMGKRITSVEMGMSIIEKLWPEKPWDTSLVA
jgi:hypothetical protein